MSGYNEVRDALGAAILTYKSTMNVFNHVPRTLVPPAAIIQPRPNRTIDYVQALSSGLAKWNFTVLLIIGLVNEQSAQDEAGDLISPGSPLIAALQSAPLPNGFAHVTDGAISEMSVGQSLYTYAQLSVVVTS